MRYLAIAFPRHRCRSSSSARCYLLISCFLPGLCRGLHQGVYSFSDGLRYDEGDWNYCDEDDRRFYSERLDGVKPAGMSQLVDKGEPIPVPQGTFDVGDGYYDPEIHEIRSYDGKPLRKPNSKEAARIVAMCRTGA